MVIAQYKCPYGDTITAEVRDPHKGNLPDNMPCVNCHKKGRLVPMKLQAYGWNVNAQPVAQLYVPTAEEWDDIKASSSGVNALAAIHIVKNLRGMLMRPYTPPPAVEEVVTERAMNDDIYD